jgi:uroporphyrinogen-III synthase
MDSQTLLAELDLAALRGKRVLIVRGESGRELLADSLRAAGVQVELIAAYRRVAPKLNATTLDELKQLLCCHNVWIVTSSEALRVWSEMVAQLEDAEAVAKMQHKEILVPHARIAETAQQLGFRHIVVTRSGDDGLIAALQSRP